MSQHPDKELLSAHADASAPASERAMLDEHLGSCADCRKEFAGLKAVSKLVADLPKAELPVGFMARLERRRLAGEAAPAAFTFPGHSPWRLAGFAATGVLVCLVFFREVRYRLAPEMLGDAAYTEGDTGIRSSVSVGFADDSDVASARQAAVSRGAWNGVSQEAAPASQAAPAEAPPAPAAELSGLMAGGKAGGAGASVSGFAPARARLKPGGAPLGAEGSSSNEEIQAHLEQEKRRMGIREIVPPSAPAAAAGDGLPDRPLSKSEAMDYMRSMTRQLTRLNRDANDKKRPTVEIGAGATPRIIGSADVSQPLEGKKDAAKFKAADKGSLGMVRGSVRVDEPASFEPPPLRRAEFSAQKVVASAPAGPSAPGASGGGLPAKPIVPRGFWSSTQGGPGADGGAVITKAEDWADLWSRIGRAEALPTADFSKEMAVAVFAARDEENRRSVEVVSLVEEGGRLVIRYRLKDEGVKAPSAPYHVVLAPKSELPYEFVLVK